MHLFFNNYYLTFQVIIFMFEVHLCYWLLNLRVGSSLSSLFFVESLLSESPIL